MSPLAPRSTPLAVVKAVLTKRPWFAAAVTIAMLMLVEGAAARVGAGPAAFIISGTASELVPGAPGDLELVLHNPQSVEITVTSVEVFVHDASPACGQAYVVVPDYSGAVVLPPGGDETISLPITLSPDTPESCQLVAFPLTFTGSVGRP